ncbi:MAG TPA: acetyl ornithine aminotransferase family protein [Candidatus Cryosericum sp.]|jgi:4-aminobutyrate aminotransferase
MARKDYIELKTAIPGPTGMEWYARDRASISPSYVRPYVLVADHAEGMQVTDVDGNTYLDFTAGVAVNSTGHRHPEVVQAIKDQADKLVHMSGTDFFYPIQIELAEKIKEITPGPTEKMVWYGNSGAEAVEAGLKLARYHTKRSLALAFFGGFHGRTYGAVTLSGSKAKHREGFSPMLQGVVHVPYAYCYRCPYGLEPETCGFRCIGTIEEVMERIAPPSDTAVMVVEPIQGEGGYVMPPPGYFQKLRELTEQRGILLMVDEVQSGMGRTGKMFAIEHWDTEPDIMAIAKGVASGLPLGIMVAKKSVMDWKQGAHGSTFGGNPLSCAAALKTIELIQNGLMKNATVQGEYIMKHLRSMQKKHPLMGDVRGKGLMIGVEFVRDGRKTKAKEESNQLVLEAFKRGLLLLPCGENCVRLSPSLTVTRDQCDVMLDVWEESLTAVEQQLKN